MSLLELDLALERREEQIRQAAQRRRLGAPSPSIRQSIGRAMIRAGQRMAAEPSLSLARPR